MACQIKRKEDGTISEVLAPNGKPSILYRDLVIEMPNIRQDVLQDEYVKQIVDSEYVQDSTDEEVALAAWSKAYTADFIDSFGNWKEDKLPNTDSNDEPTISMLFPEITDTGVKAGVSELFESNPELANIGTQEQYAEYLDNIFPDSRVKDIVYHYTTNEKFNAFDKTKTNIKGKKSKTTGIHFFNSPALRGVPAMLNQYGSNEIPAILNVKELFDAKNYPDVGLGTLSAIEYFNRPLLESYLEEKSIRLPERVDGYIIYGGEYVVENPEQVHILGSKQDIAGFKQFVSNPLPTSTKWTEIKNNCSKLL